MTLPDIFDTLLEGTEAPQQLLFKVPAELDWRRLLDGRRLRLRAGAAPEVFSPAKTQPADATLSFVTTEIKDPWRQYIPMRPEEGTAILKCSGVVRQVLHLRRETDELRRIEEDLQSKRKKAAKGEKRKFEAVTHQRTVLKGLKKESQKRFRISSTSKALKAMGFKFGDSGDAHDQGEPQEEEEEVLHFKPLSEEESKGRLVPLAFWTSGPISVNMKSQVELKVRSGSRVEGHAHAVKVKSAPQQAFRGICLKRAAKSLSGHRYLLGVRPPASKRLWLEEATVFRIEAVRKTSKEELDIGKATAKAKTYGQLRGEAVHELGTKTRQRQTKLAAARQAREYKIVEFGSYKAELMQRAEELNSRVRSHEEKDADLKAKILPPFDVDATDPRKVYAGEALNRIAPPDLIAEEMTLASQDMLDLLQDLPAGQLQAIASRLREKEIPFFKQEATEVRLRHACRSRLSAAVLKQRAKAGLQAASEDEAMALATKFGVLEKLVTLLAKGGHFRAGKVRPDGVAQLLDLRNHSLAAAWHREYYDGMLNKTKVRTFQPRRTLCYLMIWALHLTPNLSLDVPTAIEREMGLMAGQLKKALEYIGCSVTEEKQMGGLDTPGSEPVRYLAAKLEGPPKLNENFYRAEERRAKGDKDGPGGR